jgi:hypothetical protein
MFYFNFGKLFFVVLTIRPMPLANKLRSFPYPRAAAPESKQTKIWSILRVAVRDSLTTLEKLQWGSRSISNEVITPSDVLLWILEAIYAAWFWPTVPS